MSSEPIRTRVEGHILEVTPEGDVVWEFVSPHRAGAEHDLIATVMGARRIPTEQLTFLD